MSETTVVPQQALFESPGLFSGVQIWRGSVDRKEAMRLANEHVLIAFATDRAPFLPMQRGDFRFPSTQADVLVQVADDDRLAMLEHLRKAKAFFSAWCDLDEELIGGKIADGREPFGFRDGLKAPSHAEIKAKAICADGGSFLLYQRYEQALERFGLLRERAQDRVFGITREGHDIAAPPQDAHVQRARKWGHFIRRGFPYRSHATEGLAFIAAGNDVSIFVNALEDMLGKDWDSAESLLRYAEALSGGLYLAPPR